MTRSRKTGPFARVLNRTRGNQLKLGNDPPRNRVVKFAGGEGRPPRDSLNYRGRDIRPVCITELKTPSRPRRKKSLRFCLNVRFCFCFFFK